MCNIVFSLGTCWAVRLCLAGWYCNNLCWIQDCCPECSWAQSPGSGMSWSYSPSNLISCKALVWHFEGTIFFQYWLSTFRFACENVWLLMCQTNHLPSFPVPLSQWTGRSWCKGCVSTAPRQHVIRESSTVSSELTMLGSLEQTVFMLAKWLFLVCCQFQFWIVFIIWA